MESKNKPDKQAENNPRNLMTMIKEITEALNQFMEVTNKEIENIKKMVEINHKSYIIEQKETKKDKEIIESRIQNIIISHKELCQKWDAIESLVEGIKVNSDNILSRTPKNTSYINYKNSIIEQKRKQRKSITQAILYNKYLPNKARIITKPEGNIKVYNVSINHRNYRTNLFIKFNNKWQKLNTVADKLREEGLVFGFKNMINALRSRHNASKINANKPEMDTNKRKSLENNEKN